MNRAHWNPHEERRLAAFYADIPAPILAKAFRRPVYAVYNKARALGLRRNPAWLNEAGRKVARDPASVAHRFQRGHQSWNAGMKGWKAGGRSEETRFKKGNRPHTWRPIGSERDLEGYLQVKVTDTGYPPRDWRCVHVMLWEKHHGPVPSGHAVVFRDGNRRNIVIDNLELITRGELMRRNTIHRYPPELKQAIRAAGKLRRTIERATQ